MAGTRLTENPSIHGLFSLLEEIRNGGIRLPKFQRPFVWDEQQRIDLLDSVFRGLPIGSVLVWRTANPKLPTYDDLSGWRVAPEQPGSTRSLLIDGHQRLMTLLAAFYPPDGPTEVEPTWYNLEAQRFEVSDKTLVIPSHWIPLDQLRTNSLLIGVQRTLIEKKQGHLVDRAEALRNAFVEYRIPVVPMVSDEFREVAVAFQRINRGSSPMGEVHMVHALVAAGDLNLLEALEELRYDLPLPWRALDQQTWLMLIKIANGKSAYDKDVEWLASTIIGDPGTLKRVTRQLVRAVDLLKTIGVLEPNHLPYNFQLIFFAHGFGLADNAGSDQMETTMRRWFWRSSLTNQFAGISEGRLSAVLKAFEQLLAEPETARLAPTTVDGPVNPRRASARLRNLKAFLRMTEHPDPDGFVEAWRRDPDGYERIEAIEAERDCAARAGLEYSTADDLDVG